MNYLSTEEKSEYIQELLTLNDSQLVDVFDANILKLLMKNKEKVLRKKNGGYTNKTPFNLAKEVHHPF